MKLVYLIATLFSFSALAGFPPTSLKGQSQASATTTFSFQVPNNQATKTSTGTLIETGSQNLLSNPGFEHSTASTGWNVTSGTLTTVGTAPFGNFYGSFTGSVANGNIQSTTGSGTAQAGLNCLVSAFVKTSSNNVQLCAIHNGTLNTNLCVNVNPSNTWAQYQIPTVCDAVSTVARVRITTSVSTTFNVDNVYVGVNPNISQISQNQSALLYFPATASSTPTFTSSTLVDIPTLAAIPAPILVNNSIPGCSFSTTDTNNFNITSSGDCPAGKYTVSYGGVYNTQSGGAVTSFRVSDGTTNGFTTANNIGTAAFDAIIMYQFNYTTSKTLSFKIQAAISAGTGTINNQVSSIYVRIDYEPPSSNIISTNNQDYDWTAYTPTFTGLGTVTNISFYHKRVGSDLHIRGKWTNGTRTATEMRISLPSGLTSLSSLATIELAGRAVWGGGSYGGTYEVLIEPSVSYMTFGYSQNASGALAKVNGDTIFTASSTQSLYAKIPIQGWNNNNVIVGTFAGVGNIKGLNNSVNEVMFGFGTTTQYTRCTASPCTIFENGSAFNISVTRSTTGIYQIVFPSDFSPTVKPKCWLTGKESSVSRAGYCGYQSTNPTNTTINLECRDGTSNIADVYMDVFCKGY